MNTMVVRGLCLIALVASLAVRHQAVQAREALMGEFDIGAAIARVVRERGFALRENPVKPPKVLSSVVYFQRPDCDRVSLVMPYFISAEAQHLLARVMTGDLERRFIYFDRSWPAQQRVSMFFAWLEYAVRDVFGASRYVPVKTAIVLAEPRECQSGVAVDWRQIWDQEFYRGAERGGNGNAVARVGS